MLVPQYVSNGLEILRTNSERICQAAGYRVPTENGQFMNALSDGRQR